MEACQQILNVLKDPDNWVLTGDFDRRNITFRREAPLHLSDRFIERTVSIEVCKGANPRNQRSLARILNFEIVNVHLWIIIQPLTDERYQELLDSRQAVQELIDDIILTNQRSIAGIKYVTSRNWMPVTSIGQDEIPDSLHSVNELVCHYQTLRV